MVENVLPDTRIAIAVIDKANSKNKNKNKRTRVFGLFFILVGLFVGAMTGGRQVVYYLSTSHWVEVPAVISSLELQRKSGSDSTTYSVDSTYSYSYEGSSYTSDRVTFSNSSDNIGSYWQDLYSELSLLRRTNEVSAFVNPDDPSESFLDRSLRWQLIVFGSLFIVMFGGAGALLWWGWSPNKQVRRKNAIKGLPGSGGILSNDKQSAVFMFVFGCVFFLIGSGIGAILLPEELAKGNYAALLVLLFAVIGVGVMYAAFKRYLVFKKFGYAPLALSPPEPGVGGQLGGTFTVQAEGLSQRNRQSFIAHLVCTQTYRKGKNTRRSVLWQEESPVYSQSVANGTGCRFVFDIPETCVPTRPRENGSAIDWAVSVEGQFDDPHYGIFKRKWPVVVGDLALGSASNVHIPAVFLQEAKAEMEVEARQSIRDQFELVDDGTSLYMHTKAGQHVMIHLLGILFGGVFASIGFFTISSWLPGILFILFGLLVLLAFIHMLGTSIHVNIYRHQRTLHIKKCWFGVNYSTDSFNMDDASQFTQKRTSSSQSGHELTEYYAVYVSSNGKKTKIAKGVKGKRSVDELVSEITEYLFKPGL